MRTSTVFFLVLFLVLASSHERRERMCRFAARAASEASSWLSREGRRHASADVESDASTLTVPDGPSRARIRALERRVDSAQRAQRTVDRGVRMLDDRLRHFVGGNADEVQASTAALLRRQREELVDERVALGKLVERLRAEIVALSTAAELDAVRAERALSSALLVDSAGSPLDGLDP